MQGKVAIGVIERDRKFLILQRAPDESSGGRWCFPGGKIEEKESAREAALREVKEETGLDATVLDDGEVFEAEGELGVWKIYPFLMEADGKVDLNYEHSDFEWADKKELEELDTLGDMKAIEVLGL